MWTCKGTLFCPQCILLTIAVFTIVHFHCFVCDNLFRYIDNLALWWKVTNKILLFIWLWLYLSLTFLENMPFSSVVSVHGSETARANGNIVFPSEPFFWICDLLVEWYSSSHPPPTTIIKNELLHNYGSKMSSLSTILSISMLFCNKSTVSSELHKHVFL